MTDVFSKFRMVAKTPDQQGKTVTKALVSRWCHTYGISARMCSGKGKSFSNNIIQQLCKLYGIQKATPYNPTEFNFQGSEQNDTWPVENIAKKSKNPNDLCIWMFWCLHTLL